MKLRDEIIQDMYDMDNNEELFEGMGLICSLEHAAFFAGANMVLDFISGKEVQ